MDELLISIESIPGDQLSDASIVDVPHTNDATYCLSSDGRRWVRKREENMGWQEFFAEVIGYLLAKRLEIPVPRAAVCLDDDHRSWLSSHIPDVAHWHSSRVPVIVNLESLGSILALDAILANPDRHAGNILLQSDPDDSHLKVWMIDMGSCLVSYANEYIDMGLLPPKPDNIARGIPLDLDSIKDGLSNTALALGRIRDHETAQLVSYASQIVREPFNPRLVQALDARCKNAAQIVTHYTNMIGGGK